MDIVKLEKELTAYFATALGKVVDTSIFRGALPENVSEGTLVRITNRIAGGMLDQPEFNVQVLGKFAARASAFALVGDFMPPMVPAYGVELTHFTITSMDLSGDPVGPYAFADKGRVLQCASVNLRISVLTKPAIEETPQGN